MSATDEVRDRFTSLWSRLGPMWGIPPSTARLHAWLLSRPEGADAETLSEELGLSRGAVSMACKELLDWGLIVSARPAGNRRVIFRAESALERAIVSIIRTRKRKEWDPLLAEVRQWREELALESSSEATHMGRLFAELEGVVGMVEATARAFLSGFVIRRIGLKSLLRAARGKEEKAS